MAPREKGSNIIHCTVCRVSLPLVHCVSLLLCFTVTVSQRVSLCVIVPDCVSLSLCLIVSLWLQVAPPLELSASRPSQWHRTDDSLEGSQSYGLVSENPLSTTSFSAQFDQTPFGEYLVATGMWPT